MRKVKVFLQKPWKVSDSSYYRYLSIGLPSWIEYVNLKKSFSTTITSSKDFWRNHNFRQRAKKFFRITRIPLVNAKYTKNSERYDLIHCAHCLSKNKKTSWICDIEHAGQFYIGGESWISKKRVKKILHRKNCRKILAWTNWSEKNILKEFSELRDKIEIVYPALPLGKIKKRDYKKINLLFVGRDFIGKGGEIFLEAVDFLTKKYDNVYGMIISDTPKKFYDKYSKNEKIKFSDLVSQEKLFGKVYLNFDIFIYPSRSDTFGFAILEAKSFGLPVVATKTKSMHTINETVSDGETGFVIEGDYDAWGKDEKERRRIIGKIIGKVELLVKDKKLLRKMSENCIKEFRSGKFSIIERNKKLERIFREADL